MCTCPYCKSLNTTKLKIKKELLIAAPLDENFKENGLAIDVKPVVCNDCGVIFDSAPNPSEYVELSCKFGYASATSNIGQNHFNGLFNLVHKYVKKNAKVLEIGGKSGRLLSMLEADGFLDLTGYDPAAVFEDTKAIKAVKDFFTTDLVFYNKFDCFISQNCLSFFKDLQDFLGFLHKNLNKKGYFILENVKGNVPTASQFWFLPLGFYERLAKDNGFNIIDAMEESGKDGFLRVVMQKREDGERYCPYFSDAEIEHFKEIIIKDINEDIIDDNKKSELFNMLKDNLGQDVVLWGTGSSAFRILDCIDKDLLLKTSFFVVDSDESRKGKIWVSPVSGRFKVHSINDLKNTTKKALIIAASSEYIAEIKARALDINFNYSTCFCIK